MKMNRLDRRDFVIGCASALGGLVLPVRAGEAEDAYTLLQDEINAVRKEDYKAYLTDFRPEYLQRFTALQRLEDAFDRIKREVAETVVTDRPAVWFLYNMGLVVKTPQACFSVDLMHRRAQELAPLLDFALITHNHVDHYTEAFYAAMNGSGKTVISNFKDNYGVRDWGRGGGYTRAVKTFRIKDVEVTTGYADHNPYLVDFTSTFEIKTCGVMIYHTGDCYGLGKLNPSVTPDLWCVHPRCGLSAAEGVRKFHPRMTAVLHLNEMGHDVNQWRWTWGDGLAEKSAIESAGGRAVVPVWGERLSVGATEKGL